MVSIPPIRDGFLSDELYDECMKMTKLNMGESATQWIHLADAVSRGTISSMEAYTVIQMGYLPESLKVRPSKYTHLL